MPAPWKLDEANYAQIKEAAYEVAMLPLGATEPHNLHLPYGTDTLESLHLSSRICEEAHRRGAKVILLPPLPFGTQTNHRGFPLALNLYPTTILQVIRDLVESIVLAGIHKIVLFNSHGGNDLKPVLRELYGQTPAHLFLCFWPQVIKDVAARVLQAPDDHAGEMETSLALAHFPSLIARDQAGGFKADAGTVRRSRFAAVEQGWVSITRPWHLLTTNSGSGNPHAATEDKGVQLTDALVERVATFLVELSASPLDELFPFTDN